MELKNLRLPALVVFGIYAIYSCALAPLYQFLSVDIILSDTIWWDIVDFLFNLFEVLGIAACFGFLIHGIYHYTAKECRPLDVFLGGRRRFGGRLHVLYRFFCDRDRGADIGDLPFPSLDHSASRCKSKNASRFINAWTGFCPSR